MSRLLLFAFVLGSTVFLAGCGTGQVHVKGSVSFAGAAVEEGSISFLPEPGTESRKASAAIVNGVYEIPGERGPQPGKFKIEISWVKKTGRKVASADPSMGDVDERIETIPAKYNSASVLMRDITPGENKLDFTLDP